VTQHKSFTVRKLYVIIPGNIVVHFDVSLLACVGACMPYIVIMSERNA